MYAGLNASFTEADVRESYRHVTPEDRADWFRNIKLGPRSGIKEGEREIVRRNYATQEGFNRMTEYWECETRGEMWSAD